MTVYYRASKALRKQKKTQDHGTSVIFTLQSIVNRCSPFTNSFISAQLEVFFCQIGHIATDSAKSIKWFWDFHTNSAIRPSNHQEWWNTFRSNYSSGAPEIHEIHEILFGVIFSSLISFSKPVILAPSEAMMRAGLLAANNERCLQHIFLTIATFSAFKDIELFKELEILNLQQ